MEFDTQNKAAIDFLDSLAKMRVYNKEDYIKYTESYEAVLRDLMTIMKHLRD